MSWAAQSWSDDRMCSSSTRSSSTPGARRRGAATSPVRHWRDTRQPRWLRQESAAHPHDGSHSVGRVPGVGHHGKTAQEQGKQPETAATAVARNSAAISRRALARSKPARSTYAARCRSSAGAAFGSNHSSLTVRRPIRNGASLKSPRPHQPELQRQRLAKGSRERSRQPCLRRPCARCVGRRPRPPGFASLHQRALNFAAHPHHVRVFQIRDPRIRFRRRRSSSDLGRRGSLDVVDAFVQFVLKADARSHVPAQWFVVCISIVISYRTPRTVS